MAGKIKEIQAPIAQQMSEFEGRFRQSMKSNVMLLDRIMGYIVKRKGKQMRPTFVFLCAGAVGTIGDSTFRGASLIELLHTATLVHDDVVDDSSHRRGFFSINALWKNKIAVLVGDFLLSRGLLLAIDHGDFQLLRIVSNSVREMSEGELLQIEKARNLNITEEVYYEIIRQKTASLMASCCSVGAASAGADQELVETMRLFGEKTGMAFQIKDDLFDYSGGGIGKPTGIDIRERKMTLPLIYALNQAAPAERRRIRAIISKQSHKSSKVKEVVNWVKDSGGLDYAQEVMERYKREALDLLRPLPESPYLHSLRELVEFTIARTS